MPFTIGLSVSNLSLEPVIAQIGGGVHCFASQSVIPGIATCGPDRGWDGGDEL